jgi:hypothetical protein
MQLFGLEMAHSLNCLTPGLSLDYLKVKECGFQLVIASENEASFAQRLPNGWIDMPD